MKEAQENGVIIWVPKILKINYLLDISFVEFNLKVKAGMILLIVVFVSTDGIAGDIAFDVGLVLEPITMRLEGWKSFTVPTIVGMTKNQRLLRRQVMVVGKMLVCVEKIHMSLK